MIRAWGLWWAMIGVSLCTASASEPGPRLMVLGIAQDAGYPQAGCYRPHCMAGWRGERDRRLPTSLGLIDPVQKKTWLFDATPALPEQLYRLHAEAPDHALSGVFLTHAHMGHYTGLMHFGREAMGSRDLPVHAMPRMRRYLDSNGPWSQLVALGNITLMPLQDQQPVRLGAITVTPLRVPHRDEFSETVGFRIEGPSRSAVFIPDIDKWSRWETDLIELIRSVDHALLDATFYDNEELPGRDMSEIPHPFVIETMKQLQPLDPEERSRVWLIHLNHSNPLLDANSAARKTVLDAGFRIAEEGQLLAL